MKRILNWAVALMLICGSPLLTACSSDDNSSEPSKNPEAEKNRELLAAHFKADAAVLNETLDYDAIDLSTQATKQLLALMNKSRYFKDDMKTMMALLTIQNAADKSKSHGVRVVFDEKGNYKAGSGDGMAFIFPAAIDGYAKMLYKLSMVTNRNWSDIPEQLTVILSCMHNDKEVVLNRSVSNVKLNSAYPGMAAIVLGTFDSESKIDYSLPDAGDRNCTIDLKVSKGSDDMLNFDFGYVQDKLNILRVSENFPMPTDLTVSSIREAMADGSQKVVDATLLDDLFVKGDVNGNMQIACGKGGKDIPMQLVKEQVGDVERLMPVFALDYSSTYTPLKEIVDAGAYENILNIYHETASSVSTSAAVYSDLLTMLMQILPIGVTK